MGKKGKANTLLIALDVVGFSLLFLGGALIRFSRDDVISAIGGFVLAGGVTILTLTRLIK